MMNDKYTQSADFQAIVKNGIPDYLTSSTYESTNVLHFN
jgi:hypothetical protein